MKIVYDPQFIKKLKKTDIRIQKSVKLRILIFSKNPANSLLKNHPLHKGYLGYRSININADWRAVYKTIKTSSETVAYFITLGTHEELYKSH